MKNSNNNKNWNNSKWNKNTLNKKDAGQQDQPSSQKNSGQQESSMGKYVRENTTETTQQNPDNRTDNKR